MKYIISILIISLPLLFSFRSFEKNESFTTGNLADPDSFPVPSNIPGLLFYIQRDPNSNTIVYELNTDKAGRISDKEPVHTFWIRYPEGGMRKDLNYLQRKFAYGINTKPIGNGNYELRSVAYSKLPLYLRRDVKNQYHVYADIGNRKCILNRVFIRIDGGSFWSPNVLYIELKGIEITTGKIITQRIKPS
ncbi:DUF4833 domain-containing protein [Dyadobacter psychrotolerans]|uniref:DUF4833 domain-containing protein n=1 Tax=Dyadobacter psychrotolerans TaxID=2541721 RepID=A0A4R5DC66_9BACT|nr:DUF4833 domain-containing protein [Dyadobacter psychrotolerans]TDE11316.1 DUF4833 domain-containing protein [Dyadobacter psychrotolerans]